MFKVNLSHALKLKTYFQGLHLYHVWFGNTNFEVPILESVLIMNEFPDIFSDDLSGVLPKRYINFNVDLLPNTHLISIPPYNMAPTKLKKMKDQSKDLLDKSL